MRKDPFPDVGYTGVVENRLRDDEYFFLRIRAAFPGIP